MAVFRHAGRVTLARIGDLSRPLYPFLGKLVSTFARSAADETTQRYQPPFWVDRNPQPIDENTIGIRPIRPASGRPMSIQDLYQFHLERGTLAQFLRRLKTLGQGS